MSMIGELMYFIGFQVKKMKDGNFLSQEKYTKDLLKRFNMEKCKPIKTPMPTNGHLNQDEGGNPVDQTLYHSMITSLLYLTTSRPDIMFSVCMLSHPVLKVNRMRTMYVPGSVIHVHSDYINDSSLHNASNYNKE
jgi:hypothetical protein